MSLIVVEQAARNLATFRIAMATRKSTIDALCSLRLAVALCGQRGLAGWWDTEFLTQTGIQLLGYNFPRNPLLAAYAATSMAAKRVHDDRIGQRSVFHLFRLPATLEREVCRHMSEAKTQTIQPTHENAMARIRRLAGQVIDAPEGPVQVGTGRDLLTTRGVEEMASHYLSGFERKKLTLPYVRGDK